MKQMNKRFWSLLLCMMLALAMLPATASADPMPAPLQEGWTKIAGVTSGDTDHSVYNCYGIAVNDSGLPDVMPNIYVTTGSFFYRVMKGTYNSGSGAYTFSDIGGTNKPAFDVNNMPVSLAIANHFGDDGNLYVATNNMYTNPAREKIWKVDGAGWTDITYGLGINSPSIATSNGDVYAVPRNSNRTLSILWGGSTVWVTVSLASSIRDELVAVAAPHPNTSGGVFVLDKTGKIWRVTFGEFGPGTTLEACTLVATAPSGSGSGLTVYAKDYSDKHFDFFVADATNDCVQALLYETNGSLPYATQSWVVMKNGSTNAFVNPTGVAVDSMGNLYVTDPGAANVGTAGTGAVFRQHPVPRLSWMTQPGNGVSGGLLSLQPTVKLMYTGLYGDMVATGNSINQMTVTLTSGSGTLLGTQTVTLQNGVAAFTNLGVTGPGTYTLTATCAGLSSVSNSFTINSPPPTYSVTVQNDGHGTGSADPATAAEDATVTLSSSPSAGYHFKEWQVVSPSGLTLTGNTFIMPGEAVTVKAVFEADPAPAYTGPLYFKVGAGENRFYYGDPDGGGIAATDLSGWSFAGGVLTLDGFEWETPAATALAVTGGDLTIRLADGSENSVVSNFDGDGADDTFGIYMRSGLLTIEGDTGSLTVRSGGTRRGHSFGIYMSTGALEITGGHVIAMSRSWSGGVSGTCGGIGAHAITISGGTVNAEATDAKTSCYGIFGLDVTIEGGTVNATAGWANGGGMLVNGKGVSVGLLAGAGDVRITGGAVNATSDGATNLSAGIGAMGDATVSGSGGNVLIAGGSVSAAAGDGTDDESLSFGIAAVFIDEAVGLTAGSLSISGCTVTATGHTQALFTMAGPITIAAAYRYWTNTDPSESGAVGPVNGFATPFANTGGIYKYVKIAPAPKYTVTVTNGSGEGSYAQGATVTLIAGATPGGQRFKEWSIAPDVTLVGGTAQTDSTVQFIMPGEAVAASAVYEDLPPSEYAINVQSDGNGTASASASSAAAGTEITLSATPNGGYRLKEWQVVSGGVTIADNKFFMPANDVTVKAIFESTAVSVTGITVTGEGEANSVTVTGTLQMHAAVEPSEATNKDVTWSIAAGSGGASINPSGLLTASEAGKVTVRATAQDGSGVYGEKEITITNPPPAGTAPTIATTSLPGGAVGTAYTATLAAAGDATIAWSVDTGALPAGLSLSTTGVLSGTPTAAGTFNFTVEATNEAGSDTQALGIVIRPATQPETSQYAFRTLTNQATGVTVSGAIHKDAWLTVTNMNLGNDPACDAIRAAQKRGDLILGFDIGLSHGYLEPLTISIPVGSAYDGRTVTILHCVNGKLETFIVVVANGKATFTVTSLSPFAVVRGLLLQIDPPRTGDTATLWGFVMIGLAVSYAGWIVLKRRRA